MKYRVRVRTEIDYDVIVDAESEVLAAKQAINMNLDELEKNYTRRDFIDSTWLAVNDEYDKYKTDILDPRD